LFLSDNSEFKYFHLKNIELKKTYCNVPKRDKIRVMIQLYICTDLFTLIYNATFFQINCYIFEAKLNQ